MTTPDLRPVPEPFVTEPYFHGLPGILPLLRDIAQEPDEVRLRLVLADWLEDVGEVRRAEHVRVECQMQSMPTGRRRTLLFRRLEELYAEDGKRWLEGAPACASNMGLAAFEGGLLE